MSFGMKLRANFKRPISASNPRRFHDHSTKVSAGTADKIHMFEWNAKYATGIASIDAQHKGLFSIGAELHAAMSAGQAAEKMRLILNRLLQYTAAHFAYEERVMQLHHYAGYVAHKAQHDDLTRQVTRFYEDVQSGKIGIGIPLLKFMEDWLTQHIGKTDMAYVPFLTTKAVA